MHHRGGAPLPGRGQHGVVLQRQQAAAGGDAVGEGGQIGYIGELGGQERGIDIGVGVPVEGRGAQPLIPVGDHQDLAGGQVLHPAQRPVIPPELADGGPIGRGDGGQRLSGLYGVDLTGEADDQGLSHSQSAVSGDGIVGGETDRVNSVMHCDGADGFAGLHDMDRHLRITSPEYMRKKNRAEAGSPLVF